MVQDFYTPDIDISHLVTEDDQPVDNLASAKQQRLLVEPLYTSQPIALPFLADANVGVFYALKSPPVVPDVFLSLGVSMPSDWSKKENRSYFLWEFGKPPDIAIEIISNREGHELGSKFQTYAQIGIAYYVVYDPLEQLQGTDEMNSKRLRVYGLTVGRYRELSEPYWFTTLGLGLTLWQGEYEAVLAEWLRWCDRDGNVVPTGAEKAEIAEAKANMLAAKLRSLGIDPNSPNSLDD